MKTHKIKVKAKQLMEFQIETIVNEEDFEAIKNTKSEDIYTNDWKRYSVIESILHNELGNFADSFEDVTIEEIK